jgi:hypothetical protein
MALKNRINKYLVFRTWLAGSTLFTRTAVAVAVAWTTAVATVTTIFAAWTVGLLWHAFRAWQKRLH